MRRFQRAQAFGRGDQVQAFDARAAGGLQQRDGRHQGAAGGQHRVEDQGGAVGEVADEIVVIGFGLQRRLVAADADHAHLRRGNQLQHAGQQAQAGTQDRHQGELAPLQAAHRHRPGPAGFLRGLQRQVRGGLHRQQRGHLGGELTEGLGAGVGAAHQAELVLDQRVAALDDLHGATLAQAGLARSTKPHPRPWRRPVSAPVVRPLKSRSLGSRLRGNDGQHRAPADRAAPETVFRDHAVAAAGFDPRLRPRRTASGAGLRAGRA